MSSVRVFTHSPNGMSNNTTPQNVYLPLLYRTLVFFNLHTVAWILGIPWLVPFMNNWFHLNGYMVILAIVAFLAARSGSIFYILYLLLELISYLKINKQFADS